MKWKRKPKPKPMNLALSHEESLVLHEFLSRFEEIVDEYTRSKACDVALHPMFESHAEELVLWRLNAQLEKTLVEPFRPDYPERIYLARERVLASK